MHSTHLSSHHHPIEISPLSRHKKETPSETRHDCYYVDFILGNFLLQVNFIGDINIDIVVRTLENIVSSKGYLNTAKRFDRLIRTTWFFKTNLVSFDDLNVLKYNTQMKYFDEKQISSPVGLLKLLDCDYVDLTFYFEQFHKKVQNKINDLTIHIIIDFGMFVIKYKTIREDLTFGMFMHNSPDREYKMAIQKLVESTFDFTFSPRLPFVPFPTTMYFKSKCLTCTGVASAYNHMLYKETIEKIKKFIDYLLTMHYQASGAEYDHWSNIYKQITENN